MFNKDEKNIRKNFGKANPFSVPDGYFDNLTDRIVASIREESANANQIHTVVPKVTQVHVLKPRYRRIVASVAASVCIGIMSLGAYLHVHDGSHRAAVTPQHPATEQVASDYSSFDAMLDYSMMDTNDMYAYMAESN